MSDKEEMKCPGCGEWSTIDHDEVYGSPPPSEWRKDLFECEVCGGHPHAKCPGCNEWIEAIFTTFEVRPCSSTDRATVF